MNLDGSAQLAGIVALNLIALILLLVTELQARRRKTEEPHPETPAAVGLDRWIEEIEEVEQRQAFASGGEFLPRQNAAAEG